MNILLMTRMSVQAVCHVKHSYMNINQSINSEIREEWQGSEMHIQRTQTMLEGLESDFNSLLEKAHQFHLWLDQCQAKVITPTTISPYTEEVEKVLQEIQVHNHLSH